MKQSKGVARVAALYGQVERMRLIELQEAAAAVAEAERVRAAAEAACEERRSEERAALVRGEGLEWRLAQGGCEALERTMLQAVAMRKERETSRASAEEGYRTSRLQAEQAAQVVVELRAVENGLEARREQAAADDRYAARLCWARMKAG